MGNAGLLRCKAKMTLLHPHLGETRRQELAFLALLLDPVSTCEGGRGKKGTLKSVAPYQNKPFRGPYNKKRGSYRKRPYGGNSSQSSNQSFSSGTSEAPRVVFNPTIGDEGMGTPPPNDFFNASLSPPVGGRLRSFRRDWQTNKCSIKRVKHYHQWLHTAIPLKTKLCQISFDSIRIQGPSKRPSYGRLYPVSSVKERNRKSGKCKVSGFTVACF